MIFLYKKEIYKLWIDNESNKISLYKIDEKSLAFLSIRDI